MAVFDMHTSPLLRATDPPQLVGDSDVIVQLRSDIEVASRSDAKVLVAGETGVGKEVVAQLIHRGGTRQRQPFVAINCAGLPDSLLESELFGHVRGSFTGAYRDKPGLATQADRGTLFLDELGEMSARMQGVLLRFVETGEVHRLGADRVERRVDTRIIAATNRNLLDRILSGEFREDLYYRLNVIHICVPPLRERGTDILRLFNYYLQHYCRAHQVELPELMPATEELLVSYRWPGNVRELRNIAERVTVRNHRNGPIRPDMLPAEIRREATLRAAAVLPPVPVNSANGAAGATAANPVAPVPHHPAADAAWNDMIIEGKSFWLAVHPLFIERELTKSDVREIIRRGLRQTQGSYRKLIELFHLPATDYKRFLAFLYQHDCHLAFHPFREQRPAAIVEEPDGRRARSV